jgi:hypothetical protein
MTSFSHTPVAPAVPAVTVTVTVVVGMHDVPLIPVELPHGPMMVEPIWVGWRIESAVGWQVKPVKVALPGFTLSDATVEEICYSVSIS